MGGAGNEAAFGIAVGRDGSVYVTGDTTDRDFPVVNAVQSAYAGGRYDAFVAKLTPDGSSLAYSSYLGGTDEDHGWAVAVDPDGRATVTGDTRSTDFPTTATSFQPAAPGAGDAFVTKLEPGGSAFTYSTYLGGTISGDRGMGIAADSSGSAYVTGLTYSEDFPTLNAFQPVGGFDVFAADAFVTKLNPAGTGLVYSTFLGGHLSSPERGDGDDEGTAIAVDTAGSAYVTGFTTSIDFPTKDAVQPAFAGGFWDAFVTKMSPDGSAPSYSTYLGGSVNLGGGDGEELGYGIAVDSNGSAAVTGRTSSIDFPIPSGAPQTQFGGAFGDA